MKLLFLLLFILQINLTGKQFLYVCSNDGLLTFSINSENGQLKLIDTFIDPHKRGYKMTKVSPNKNFLYAHVFRHKKHPAAIQTFKIQKNGKLKKITEIASSTGNHVYIDIDTNGDFMYALGENSEKEQVVIAYKINNGICDSSSFTEARVGETGQHAVAMSPKGQHLYVPHIRINKIYQFNFNRNTNKITPLSPPYINGPNENEFPTAHDPRHLIFHPKLNIMYTSLEFGGGISSWKINSNGSLQLWQTFQNRPINYKYPFDSKNPEVILNKSSDIHMTSNAKFIYVPNRDNRTRRKVNNPQLPLSSGNDTITTYSVNKDGSLSHPLQNIDTGRHVRCLTSFKNFLYATGVYSGTIHTYRIDQNSGKLTEINLKNGLPLIQNIDFPMWMSQLSLEP